MKLTKGIYFIIITMFLNFLGFSIIIPVLPFLVQDYTEPARVALYVGLLTSVYAFCQFLASPGLGALGDTWGRRPVLLLSLLGSIVGYILLGIGGSLWILFLGRIIDGLTGGNISTVYSYVADIIEPKERGKYYGLLGAAGGFGFMFGPAIGGFLGHLHVSAPFYLAAVVTLVNVVWGYFVLPESLSQEHRSKHFDFSHLNPFGQIKAIFKMQNLKWIFFITFLFYLALNQMQGISSVFLKDVFSWNAAQIGTLLFVVGVFDIFSQGYLVRKCLPFFGDAGTAMIGLILTGLGLFTISLTSIVFSQILFYFGVIVLIVGDGLFEPANGSLISNSVGPRMQGRVQGANQSVQSVARVMGPLLAAGLYHYWKGLPYAGSGMLIVGAIIIFILFFSLIQKMNENNVSPNI